MLMRNTQAPQLQFGEIDISKIEFDITSRDALPKLLYGLQHMYVTTAARKRVFELLEQHIGQKVSLERGRRGMALWKILVLGVVRLNMSWSYDRVREMANNHLKIREMIGHGFFDRQEYKLQTIKDNVSLLTPELLADINQVVVAEGHEAVGKKKKLR